MAVCLALVAGCASKPQPAEPTDPEKKPVWAVATEAETAEALERKFEEAAKSFVKLKKDGVLMFCKRYKDIGSNIPTIHCLTEAQLRAQVEKMEQYRDAQRWGGKCPRGPRGCQSN